MRLDGMGRAGPNQPIRWIDGVLDKTPVAALIDGSMAIVLVVQPSQPSSPFPC